MAENLYNVKDVAKIIGVHPYTVQRWLRTGVLQGNKVGPRHWRVGESALKALILGNGEEDNHGCDKPICPKSNTGSHS